MSAKRMLKKLVLKSVNTTIDERNERRWHENPDSQGLIGIAIIAGHCSITKGILMIINTPGSAPNADTKIVSPWITFKAKILLR